MRITQTKKAMAIAQDEWVTEALTDDERVVELLLRIKHAENQLLLRWGCRQRRSQPSRLNVGGVGGLLKKERDSARASPMTPLCWSGGSGSGGSTCPSSAATVDDSTCSTSTGSGSKAVRVTNDITSSKRSKKQKIFFDLKDAENLQLKPRLDLQKIANVQATHEKRSAKNQSLKRIKLEYSDRIKNIPTVSRYNLDESHTKRRLPFSVSRKQVKTEHSYRATNESKSSGEKGFFFLPDLNMTPIEEDGTLFGTS